MNRAEAELAAAQQGLTLVSVPPGSIRQVEHEGSHEWTQPPGDLSGSLRCLRRVCDGAKVLVREAASTDGDMPTHAFDAVYDAFPPRPVAFQVHIVEGHISSGSQNRVVFGVFLSHADALTEKKRLMSLPFGQARRWCSTVEIVSHDVIGQQQVVLLWHNTPHRRFLIATHADNIDAAIRCNEANEALRINQPSNPDSFSVQTVNVIPAKDLP